jgi:hypothetical protein
MVKQSVIIEKNLESNKKIDNPTQKVGFLFSNNLCIFVYENIDYIIVVGND